MSQATTYEFKTDVKQLLDLVTHSLYSHKDVFLRELISNAADAIEKQRFNALTQKELSPKDDEFKIEIEADKSQNTLTIRDNGCGMSKDDLANNLGTVAKSGTKEFLTKLKESKNEEQNLDLIGQFGVGFYAAFMVADKVEVKSKTIDGKGNKWTSTGSGDYTLEAYPKLEPGTEITLYLKKDSLEFLEEATLRQTVKKYSDFVEFPILMEVEKSEYPLDKDGKPDYQKEPTTKKEIETLNSRKAVWLKQKSEVKKEEYKQFYQHLSNDFDEPLETIHFRAEGAIDFKSLVYIPKKAPFNIFSRESLKGLHLYINRVFIMDDCTKLIPEYLRFLKGVVDAADLPLNVSREILQDNPLLDKINKNLVSKVLGTLKKMLSKDKERYHQFYQQFGAVLKEGLHSDFTNRDKLKDLVLFQTDQTKAYEYKSLQEYLDKAPKEQTEIYYVNAENREKALAVPKIEYFRQKGFEVLLLIDPIDEWILPHLEEYQGKKLVAIHKAKTSGSDSAKDQEELKDQEKEHQAILKAIKDHLGEKVFDVRLTNKLVDSACCLSTTDDSMSSQMEQMFKAMGQEAPKPKKIFEINAKHPLLQTLTQLIEKKENQTFNEYVDLMLDQAYLTEGSQLENPLAFAKKISQLMVNAKSA